MQDEKLEDCMSMFEDFKSGSSEAIKDAEMIFERVRNGNLTTRDASEYVAKVLENAERNMSFAPDFQRGYIATFKGIFS